MWVKNILLSLAFSALLIGLSLAATSPSRVFPLSFDDQIAGVKVSMPATLTIIKSSPSDPLKLVVRVELKDLFSKANEITNSMTVQPLSSGDVKVSNRSTELSIAAGQLNAKVNLILDWHGQILGINSSASSTGSITLHATPMISDNRLSLMVQVDQPEISNDILRQLADLVEGREVGRQLAQQFLDWTLSYPTKQFPLPPQVVAIGAELKTARFEMDGSMPVGVIEGRLSNAAAQWLFF